MDPSQIDVLVQRLVANPHDEEALLSAHQAGSSDPKSYALLLERVGTQSQDPAYGAHWLSEAANVWLTTLADAHRAARALMQAIDRDPTQSTAANRLADLYRDKKDTKALVALLERRAKALAPLAAQRPELRAELAGMHEELGRLWSETLQQPKKALEHLHRALELDPSNAYAIYSAREIHKSLEQWAEAAALYEPELSIERDPARRVALLRDDADTRRKAGDLTGAARALARARQIDPQDHALQQEYAGTVIERIAGGVEVSSQERTLASELLVGLAEIYDGEHGLAYSAGALDIEPGHDRALQLYAHYARTLEREEEIMARYLAYVLASPEGAMAHDARWLLAKSYEAAGQNEQAIQMLEPLRSAADARAKLGELYQRAGRRMPSAAPPPLPPSMPAAVSMPQAPAFPARGVTAGGPEAPAAPDPAQALGVAPKDDTQDTYAKHHATLSRDPGHPEALGWTLDYLRTKRDYLQLRDVLYAAAKVTTDVATQQERLREVAALSEGNLNELDGAIRAWSDLAAIDGDEDAREALKRGLEKTERWDDLAKELEREANAETDLELKIAAEKTLAALHEQKRHDPAAAAAAWERMATLVPDDDQALATAARLFDKAGRTEQAARVLAEGAPTVDDPAAKATLLEQLGELRERLHDVAGAGQAYGQAAEAHGSPRLWDQAARAFVSAGQWDQAARAELSAADIEPAGSSRAERLARAAEHLDRAGDGATAFEHLERATELDPQNEALATRMTERLTAAEKWGDLAAYLLKRADRLADRKLRGAIRKQAASLYATRVGDKDLAREMWTKVVEDDEDKEALESLAQDATDREAYAEAAELLQRVEAAATETSEKVQVALRAAALVADGLDDVAGAVERYERILRDLDPSCRQALQAIADLEEAGDHPSEAVRALDREMKLVTDPAEQSPIAERLTRLYELLGDATNAARSLEIVRAATPDDLDLLPRLDALYEKTQEWAKLAELLAERVEIEADDFERSVLTRRLSQVLADKLDRGDEALAVLDELASEGDAEVRTAYVTLGDRLGWPGIVATKLVEWWLQESAGPDRTQHLLGAFDRFVAVGRDKEAVGVACEMIRSKGASSHLATKLEKLALKVGDLDALAAAHDVLAQDMAGTDRADELVRQAEVRFAAGVSKAEALRHGEAGLAGLTVEDAEPFLARLTVIAGDATQVMDLYERQIARHRTMVDRMKALARTAQVAAAHDAVDRAQGLFDVALSATPTEESIDLLLQAARESDGKTGDKRLRTALCASLAAGGQNARDGGHTRGTLIRHAAVIAYRELEDAERAFLLLADALIARVDSATIQELDKLAQAVREPRRAEAALSRALGEVFEAQYVRLLLGRRARLRRDELGDRIGAAADLKKLYDLSTNDPDVMSDLSALLTELGDHRAMVQIYEDQILRRKDVSSRIELARKVAELWDQELDDPREAADAWRRVLRMSPGDAAASAGLERAKANMLRRPSAAPMPADDELETTSPAAPEPAAPAKAAETTDPPEEVSAAAKAEEHAAVPAEPTVEHVSAPEPPSAPPASEATPKVTTPNLSEASSDAAAASETSDAPLKEAAGASEEEMAVTDDMAEVIDVEDPPPPPPPLKPKRSLPPPLPPRA